MKRSAEQQARVKALAGIGEPFREVLTRAEELAALLRKQSSLPLKGWLVRAEVSAVPELTNFAQGIRQDEAAVAAATLKLARGRPEQGVGEEGWGKCGAASHEAVDQPSPFFSRRGRRSSAS